MEDRGFCHNCGAKITTDGAFCPACGKAFNGNNGNGTQDKIVINNIVNATANAGVRVGRAVNKWVSLILCLFFGLFGFHKFYEGKVGMGVLYLLTAGFFCIGWFIDIVTILFKPNPYYV